MRKRIAIYNNIQRRKKMKHSLRLAALVLATVIMLSVIVKVLKQLITQELKNNGTQLIRLVVGGVVVLPTW